MESKFNLNTLILLLVLAALLVVIVGGWMIFGAIRQALEPLEKAERALKEQVEEVLNPTPTIIVDPMTIVRQVRSLSRLETASYTIEKVIIAESGQGAFGFLFGDRLILVAHGQVIAGVDLGKMVDGDVRIVDADTVVVTMPPAEVLVATLNNQKTYVYDRDTGFIGMNVALETDARQAAEEEILQAALEDGILQMAQENAEEYLRNLILSLGFREVIFTQPMTPTPTPKPTEAP
jgi:hypothetical protein